MISIHFFIFIFFIINIINAELLSHTIIKFEPFQSVNILSVQHFNNSNITFTDTKKIFIHNVKKARIKRNNQRQITDAKNLLNQRIHGNSVPQCPCVIKPGTDKCIAYDSRYQAATIEEALVAFQDLTMDNDDDFKYSSTIIIEKEKKKIN
ncbi:unnamed protein product [Brugia pahangi]|uniref:Ground-like domain-containing protein n=1 Tax=Brugia pahangi TaxID=6280 RepID=A0A0N4T5M8_BRUPA|nr:unnamed protein product [Brugia pahangi]